MLIVAHRIRSAARNIMAEVRKPFTMDKMLILDDEREPTLKVHELTHAVRATVTP